MKKIIILYCFLISSAVISQNAEVQSPDGRLKLNVSIENGKPIYAVTYDGRVMLHNSPLGLMTNEGNFSEGMRFVESTTGQVNKSYKEEKIKQSSINYEANTLKFTVTNADKKQLS